MKLCTRERERERRENPVHTDVWFEGCEPNLGKTQEEHFPEGGNPGKTFDPPWFAVLRPVKVGVGIAAARSPRTRWWQIS